MTPPNVVDIVALEKPTHPPSCVIRYLWMTLMTNSHFVAFYLNRINFSEIANLVSVWMKSLTPRDFQHIKNCIDDNSSYRYYSIPMPMVYYRIILCYALWSRLSEKSLNEFQCNFRHNVSLVWKNFSLRY